MAGEHFGAVVRQIQRVYHGRTYADRGDADLLDRFASSGDEAAFTTLVERHGTMVLSVCKGVLRDPNDAQDAFQATFLVLVRKARGLQVDGSLGGWLHRVAFRIALQANEDLARRRILERRAVELGVSSGHGSSSTRDDIPVLHEELDRLPEKYRAPIVLCHLEQMSHAQAAEHLGWSVGSIRGRVARGRHLLRTRLVRRGFALTG
ncbi:RNA polymerase sigma factor, partial [Singulisphaera rosea]